MSSYGLVAAILNPLSAMSGDIDIVMIRSAVVENVGIAVGIMFVS